MKYVGMVLSVVILVIIIVGGIYLFATPAGVATWNNWWHDVQKVDDLTDYDNRKQVEDTCRAMIASYQSDKLIYEQYKDSDNEEKQSWGEQAKIRANKTAMEYNNYILKNTYIWKNNVPADIYMTLAVIE